MKIGIITVCDNDINYGSFLQMYALKKCLEDMGQIVYIVRPSSSENSFNKTLLRYKEQYVLKHDLLILRKIWRQIRITEKKIELIIRSKKYYDFCRNYHINFLDIEDARKECEIIILGSDEIWNLEHGSRGTLFYFGKDFIGKRILSYAASAGDSKKEEFVNRQDIVSLLKKIESISVRDSNTRDIVESVTDKECDEVCDPTMLIETGCLLLDGFSRSKPYILLYAWQISEREVNYLKRFADDNKVEIVCAMGGRRYEFADESVNISPLAFASAVKNAKYVYTSTFHGCIFSILNKKKAVYFCNNKKVYDLLKRFDQMERVFTDEMSYEAFCDAMKCAQDEEKLDRLISQYRECGRRWLAEKIKTESD